MKRTPLSRKTPMSRGKGFATMSAPTQLQKAPRTITTAITEAWKAVSIKPSGKRLKQTRSTGKPTKDESIRIDRIKTGECICCVLNRQNGRLSAGFNGCDAHHLLSGGRRRGHIATIGGCPWHHRGVKPFDQLTDKEASDLYGPSLAHGSKPFHAAYGTDDELLAFQNLMLTSATEQPAEVAS